MSPQTFYSRANLSFLLQIECIDLLELSFLAGAVSLLWGDSAVRITYKSEEESCFVCLQQSLRIKVLGSGGGSILRQEGGCSAQLFNELFPVSDKADMVQMSSWTFLRAL